MFWLSQNSNNVRLANKKFFLRSNFQLNYRFSKNEMASDLLLKQKNAFLKAIDVSTLQHKAQHVQQHTFLVHAKIFSDCP